MLSARTLTYNEKPIAQFGLVAKGIVYCLLGLLAIMAAFRIDGQSVKETDKSGVFDFVQDQPGGQLMLGVIALGLISYTIWRGIQAFSDSQNKGKDAKGLASRGRYLFSGLVYGYLAISAIKMVLTNASDSGDNKQSMVRELLSKPFGQWLVGIAAAILLAVGIYQIYYGLSEKYRKHAEKASHSSNRKLLLSAGKIGYVARGIVWLVISWLFFKAAIYSNSAEAGDTSKAFSFLEDAAYGPYILAAVGLGLICYGTFNFIRARYERFS
jgi:putative Mn2+ efflux pump MntP